MLGRVMTLLAKMTLMGPGYVKKIDAVGAMNRCLLVSSMKLKDMYGETEFAFLQSPSLSETQS